MMSPISSLTYLNVTVSQSRPKMRMSVLRTWSENTEHNVGEQKQLVEDCNIRYDLNHLTHCGV